MNLNSYFEAPSPEFSSAFNEAADKSAQSDTSFFFTREFILKTAAEAKLPEEATDALLKLLDRLGGEKELASVIAVLHELFLGAKSVSPGNWPKFGGALRDNEDAINLLLVLSGFPQLHKKYESKKISSEIFRDTLLDIPIWLKRLKMDNGTIGLSRNILFWHYRHFSENIYRLGRLQFDLKGKFSYACRAYRNRKNKHALALAEDGTPVNSSGFLAADAKDTAWTASLVAGEKEIRGFLVEPQGVFSRKEISLDTNEWSEAIAKDTPVLDVHIPEGDSLSVEACRDSFEKALRFFPAYYPELDFKGFICTSWIFDPAFLKILKPNSNIMSFYKEFYCVPFHYPQGTDETLQRIFGKDKERLDDAPKDTSMKKAIFEHYKNGGVFRHSGAFILTDEISCYGHQKYWEDFQQTQKIKARA